MSSSKQEEALFYAARNLTAVEARRAFLDQACIGNVALRQRIEQLLAAESDADAFFRDLADCSIQPLRGALETAAAADGALPPHSPQTEEPGTRIGRYKLLQRIGEGGCGVVYMAEQEQPVRRRVALKIIKLGMDTKNVIARFEAERQALALMDHPNIARVLDAGATATGRPYFVMELVRGMRITDYCNANHLDTRQRLDLFIQICHAIQHAHQKGIIHRDIKPSNILVTLHDGVPVPKVIDFGIAKATEFRLTEKTLFTAYEHFIGTPAYMSPEQASMSGLDVDTRSDIYSLGVLLYELLTGKTPFDPQKLLQSGLDEMRRTLQEREPQRPSAMVTTLQGEELTLTARQRQAEPPRLISLLRGDLDWIVMKALEKDRTRRYETANALALDVQRHLNNEPVSARPPSRLYRFQKLVRRNKIVFAAGGIVTVALVASVGISTVLFLMERQAHQRALAAEQQQARLRLEAEQARREEARLRREAEAREKIAQAAVLLNQQSYQAADRMVLEIPNPPRTLEAAALFRSLGRWHALEGRWQEAARRFSTLLYVNQHEGWDVATLDCLEAGCVLNELGDADILKQLREQILARFRDTTHPVAAERILKLSFLTDIDGKVIAGTAPLARLATAAFGTDDGTMPDYSFRAAWGSVSIALMNHRKGDYAQALEWAQRQQKFTDANAACNATANVIAAMACFELGRTDDAQAHLLRSRQIIDERFSKGLDVGSRDDGFWFDWFFARHLLKEANRKLDRSSL